MQEWRKKQLFALATFFFSFQGPNWREEVRSNWLDYEESECLWFSSTFGSFWGEEGRFVPLLVQDDPEPCNEAGEFINLRLRTLGSFGTTASIPPEI